MRLIDADAVTDTMNIQMDMQDAYLPIHMKVLVIDAMPTAYDVDKVVEKLEKMADKAHDNIMVSESPQYHDGYEDGVLAAIQIVKGGGVDGNERAGSD